MPAPGSRLSGRASSVSPEQQEELDLATADNWYAMIARNRNATMVDETSYHCTGYDGLRPPPNGQALQFLNDQLQGLGLGAEVAPVNTWSSRLYVFQLLS